MTKRTFDAWISTDKGQTWKKTRSSGWALSDVHGHEFPDDFGYTIILDSGDIMIDIGIPERMFKLINKDIRKLKESEETIMRRMNG